MNTQPFLPLNANGIVGSASEDENRSSDLTSRIRALFLKYDRSRWTIRSPAGSWVADDRNATTEDWQRLALALAFEHNEEGFEVYLRPVGLKSPKEDSQIERDQLVLDILDDGKCRMTGKPLTLRGASKLAAVELFKRDKARKVAHLKAGGAEMDFIPNQIDAESIRTQFTSRREVARKQGREYQPELPSYLRLFVAGAAIFDRMLVAAKIVTDQPALHRKRAE